MNIQTIIWIAVIIILCTIIFVLIKVNIRRNYRKQFDTLVAIAQNVQCELTEYDFLKDLLVGWDANKHFVFFHKKQNEEIIQKSINLNEMSSCEANRITRSINGVIVIDNLELSFFPIDKSLPRQFLEIYNSDFDSLTLTGELQLLDKWEKQLKQVLIELNN
jgi:hypothetical protein